MISQLSHVCFYTNNLIKVKKFYIDILNFKIVHLFHNPETNQDYGYFIKVGKKTYLEFLYSKKKINKKSLNHICFQTSQIYKLKKKLNKFFPDLKITRGKTDNILQFWVEDFEGNKIEFHQFDKKNNYN